MQLLSEERKKVQISGKTVLITGATGFVGGRLAERLSLWDKDIQVKALVHNFSHASRLARLPVEMVYGDVTNLHSIRRAMRDCDIVVHCAIGTSGPLKAKKLVTVHGTENTVKAALEHNIKRFIHLSSVAVYSYSPEEGTDESSDYRYSGDMYCDSKIEAEKVVLRYYREAGLPVVILRPTNIFGPYSRPWTITPINLIKQGKFVLIDGGNTPSNAVYIDNVIDAILLAIKYDDAIGEAFIISDDERITWKEFFQAYANMFPNPPVLESIDLEELKKLKIERCKVAIRESFVNAVKLPLRLLVSSTMREGIKSIPLALSAANRLRELGSQLPEGVKKHIREIYRSSDLGWVRQNALSKFDKIPSDNLIKLLTSPVQFPIEKAKRRLGYQPRISFRKGMELTEKWVRYSRLV